MASPTLKELKFRKFDDLINEVYVDLPSFAREGMVEPGQMIKVAQRVNYEIGLKIHGTKETILHIEHGRAKLPSDFYILNHALLCHHYIAHEPGLFNGIQSEDVVVPIIPPTNITTCPCWTVEAFEPNGTPTKYKKCDDGLDYGIVFPLGTTKICAQSIQQTDPSFQQLTITTDHFCYNDPNSGTFTCDKPEKPCCTPVSEPAVDCGLINPDPWRQDRVYTVCDDTMQVNVIEYRSDQIREYREFERIRMIPSKEASAFCVNTQFHDAYHQGYIRDGYIYVPTLRDHHHNMHGHAKVYICYLGAMEDEEGNLMVLDHPKINEYYEWAIKARIFENMYLNGEPDVERRLQLAQAQLKTARAEALSIATMPDFYEFQKTIENNRRAQYAKYLHPFSSLYSNSAQPWPWSYTTDRI